MAGDVVVTDVQLQVTVSETTVVVHVSEDIGAWGNDAGNNRIVNVATPTVATDAATKGYVDTLDAATDVATRAYADSLNTATRAYIDSVTTAMSFILGGF